MSQMLQHRPGNLSVEAFQRLIEKTEKVLVVRDRVRSVIAHERDEYGHLVERRKDVPDGVGIEVRGDIEAQDLLQLLRPASSQSIGRHLCRLEALRRYTQGEMFREVVVFIGQHLLGVSEGAIAKGVIYFGNQSGQAFFPIPADFIQRVKEIDKLNVILDDAAMGQDITRAVLSPFKENAYDISAVVIAVPSIVARQSVHLRFEESFAAAKQGQNVIPRWVNRDEQDSAPAALVETVETLEGDELARRIAVVDRQNNLLYASSAHAHDATATAAVTQEMRRELTAEETTVYQNKAMMISILMQAREGGMSPHDNAPRKTAASQQKPSKNHTKI